MELWEVIKKRRAVREYTNAPIERSAVERLINTAILAPSAINLQPWAFAVVLDPARIEEFGKRAKTWSLSNFGILVYLASLVFAAGTPQKVDSPR